jgi:hypothetical protein
MSEPVTFTVEAGDGSTELFLIDGRFRLVKRGIGRETFAVTPGIYKIKARSGKTVVEKMVVVQAGMNPVRLDPISINSAMPLLHSSKTHEFHIQAARDATMPSRTMRHGAGSAIVFVVRRWTARQPGTRLTPNPARGLALRGMNGAVIVNIDEQTSSSDTFDPCVTLHIAVSPGTYRLSLTYENGRRVEQALVACQGWDTHVYLLSDNHADIRQARADLVNGAITMRRAGDGFREDDPALRAEEMARLALVNDRKILSDEFRAHITRRDCSPMLALIGAHLLIREAQRAKDTTDEMPAAVDNRPAVRTIVDNLRASIGEHPDVEAIAIGAGNPNPAYVFLMPPLFRASWQLLLKASVQRPELVLSGSFGAHIAERVWGEGSWLLWLDPGRAELIDRSSLWQAKAREVLSGLDAEEAAAVDGRAASAPSPTMPTVPIPTASIPADVGAGLARPLSLVLGMAAALLPRLKSLLASRTRTPFPDLQRDLRRAAVSRPTIDLAALRTRLSEDQRRALVKAVGVPMSSIDAWLDRLDK